VKRLSLEKNVDRDYLLKNYFYNPDTGKICRICNFFNNKIMYPIKTLNSSGYSNIKICGQNYQTHHVAFYMMHGFLPRLPYTIDHINGNKLDNRKCNLRIVSNALNSQNRIKKEGTTSKYLGVSFDKKTSKYSSCVLIEIPTAFLVTRRRSSSNNMLIT
jgi:hypothetical protein